MKSSIKTIYKTGLMFLVLTISLSCIGLSSAIWTNGLNYKGSVITGNIDPIFTQATATICEQEDKDKDKDLAEAQSKNQDQDQDRKRDDNGDTDKQTKQTDVDVDITSTDGKEMLIKISEIQANSQVNIDYTITNKGSVPIKFSADSSDNGYQILTNYHNQGITIINEYPPGVIKGNNGTGRGKMKIYIKELKDKKSKHNVLKFELNMVFSQWNAVENR